MKIQTAKKLLSNAASRIQACLSEKRMAHIAMKTFDNRLTLAASDWAISVYHHIDCEVAEHGESFVHSALFANVIKELPEGTVQLERHETTLVVTAGGSFSFKFPLFKDGDGWPEPHEIDEKDELEFASDDFGYLLDQVLPSVRGDASRAYGTVGYLHRTTDGKLRLVGTDGCKLSYCEMVVDGDSPVPDKICLEKRGLAELSKICSDDKDHKEKIKVAVIKKNSMLAATTASQQMFIRVSEVDFPDYLEVLPTDMSYKAVIDRRKLQGAMKRVLLASDNSHTLQVSFSDGRIEVSASNDSSSESREVFTIDASLKEAVKLDLNGKYILEFLSTTNSDNISAGFQDVDHPIVIVPQTETPNCKSQHVLLPIKESH